MPRGALPRMKKRDEEIEIEAAQIRLVYRSSVRTVPGLALILSTLAYLIGKMVPGPAPYLWAALIFAIYSYRMWTAHVALEANLSPPEMVKHAPHLTRTPRVDEVSAARKPVVRWKP